MSTFNNFDEQFNDEILTAAELRAATITEEDLYQTKLNDMISNIAESAEKQGRLYAKTSYGVGFNLKTFIDQTLSQRMLNDVVTKFESLGYKVMVTDHMENTEMDISKDPILKPTGNKTITIDWSL